MREWFMDYRNADGSFSEMCGNGIRVFARYLVDDGLADGSAPIPVDTRDGVKTLTVDGDLITVDMGTPKVLGETTVGGRRPSPGRPATSTWATRTRSPSSTRSTTPGRCSSRRRTTPRLPGRRQRRVRRTPRRAARRDAGPRARLRRDPLLRHRRLRGDGGRRGRRRRPAGRRGRRLPRRRAGRHAHRHLDRRRPGAAHRSRRHRGAGARPTSDAPGRTRAGPKSPH